MLQPSTVYFNGQYISKDVVKISPDDRGFYFADGVYEVIKFYKGTGFMLKEHLNRLKNSMTGIKIVYEKVDDLGEVCNKLIKINQLQNDFAGIYIQITRGVSVRSHNFPPVSISPTIYCYSFPFPSFMNEKLMGVKVTTHEDIRWHRCNIKTIALLPNTLIFQEAFEKGAFECLLVREGYFTEATHSNVLFVKDGVVYSHPDSNLILPGITKSAVLDICIKMNIKVIELPVKAAEIKDFDECFLTGTGSEVTPVIQIDDKVIGNGKPGPVTLKIQKEFFKMTYSE